MITVRTVICKLGGQSHSHPEIVKSYPPLHLSSEQSKEILSLCLPVGININNYSIFKYKKYHLISYAFEIKQSEERSDLFTLSILLQKRLNAEIYKPIVKSIIETMAEKNVLSEDVLRDNIQTIHSGINEEKTIQIGDIPIDLSLVFEDIKSKLSKPKPELKGSFF
ncbi:MAG: hypothetical protein ACW986_18165 [Promethearchaeota archaeon]|jgi:hypothetical protein